MKLIRLTSALLPALLLSSTLAFAADWHHGKLMDTEKIEVPTGSTTTYNTDAKAKNGRYSGNTTAHSTDDTDTYQVFTIQTPTKTYTVRQKLNFPWSKPANISLGEEVKFMIQGQQNDHPRRRPEATKSFNRQSQRHPIDDRVPHPSRSCEGGCKDFDRLGYESLNPRIAIAE